MARLDKRVAAAVLLVAALATHISLQNLAQAERDEGKKEEGRKAIHTKDADQEIEEKDQEETEKKSGEEVGAADAVGSNNEEKSDSEVSESETKAVEFGSLASEAAAAAALSMAGVGAAAFESESETKANSESEEESEVKTESEMKAESESEEEEKEEEEGENLVSNPQTNRKKKKYTKKRKYTKKKNNTNRKKKTTKAAPNQPTNRKKKTTKAAPNQAARSFTGLRKTLFAAVLALAATTPGNIVNGFTVGSAPATTRVNALPSSDTKLDARKLLATMRGWVPKFEQPKKTLFAQWSGVSVYDKWSAELVNAKPPVATDSGEDLNLVDPLTLAPKEWNPLHIPEEIQKRYDEKLADGVNENQLNKAAFFANWVEVELDKGWKRHFEAWSKEIAPAVKENIKNAEDWKNRHRKFVVEGLKVAAGLVPENIKLSLEENDRIWLQPLQEHLFSSSEGKKRAKVEAEALAEVSDEAEALADVVTEYNSLAEDTASEDVRTPEEKQRTEEMLDLIDAFEAEMNKGLKDLDAYWETGF